MRVMLAKLLLQKPSLLMLDEPTNHLDLPSIQWVEKYVQNYEGAVIVVSHDRQFLDNTIDTTVEVSGGKLNYYAGNYSYYLEEKEERNEIQRGAYENQQAKIRQTERFIERFKAKATKSRQVQSRVKALDRMDVVDQVIDENAKVHFRFQFTTQPGRHVFQLEDASKAYGEKVILQGTNISMERGDKIALIGANGRGKSTVLRVVAGTEPIEGKRRLGHNVSFTFYAQHQLESLNVQHNLIEELKYANPNKTETELRTVLGCFLFSGDDVFKKIKVLSGGEKSRVALAKVLLSQANFLLLDEPTNHLDMQSVNILIQALQQYEGSYIVVSHDRYFVENIANKIWYIEDHEIKEYPGTYQEYEVWVEERGLQSAVSGKATVSSAPPQKNATPASSNGTAQKSNGKSVSNEDAQKLKKVQKQIEELETTINGLEIRKVEAEAKLADPKIYNDNTALAELNKFYADLKQKLNNTTESWENLMLEVDELSGK
jgi:ATP-binding cassette subfamily F protein 3